ncbi:MAG: EGF domain-containing protein, partial [Myxococcota bacterium]
LFRSLGSEGQLGYGNRAIIGDNEPPASAGDVPLGGPAVAISAGREHSCAVMATGGVRCWGRGNWAALGYGDDENIGDDETPASRGDIQLGGAALDVDAGWFHTCAVLDTGTVRCWGFGYTGQLGYGANADIGDDEHPASAGDVPVGTGVDEVAVGPYHSCALTPAGTVRCWGWGEGGRLGYANTTNIGDDEPPSVAGDLQLGGTAYQVVSGFAHNCALVEGGVIRCWGQGRYGQLGTGGTAAVGDDEHPDGAPPTLIGDVDECAAELDDCGANATCTDVIDGWTCACDPGYAGDGTMCTDIDECGEATDRCSSDATCTNTVGGHTCECDAGFTGDGRVCTDIDECADGSAGCDTNATCTNLPGTFSCACNPDFEGDGQSCTPIVGRVVDLALGKRHSCALISDGTVRCWGAGQHGRLGYGATSNTGVNDAPWQWGAVPLGGTATAISAGDEHTCALMSGGAVRCWGRGQNGRLGYGHADNIGDDEAPATAGDIDLGGQTATAIAAGGAHTCALMADGSVMCWGKGQHGRLGYGNPFTIGDDEPPSAAGAVPLGEPAVAIATGQAHSCARLQSGGVRCWGQNLDGRLGYGHLDDIGDDETPDTQPVVDLGGAAVMEVTTGERHTCALTASGEVYCWGLGLFGLLGHADGRSESIGDDEPPITASPLVFGASPIAVSAGEYHTCALLSTGATECWGYGVSGRLGYGNIATLGDNEDPAWAGPVPVGGPVAVVAGGGMHTCALLDTGEVRCWGDAAYGQLGLGFFTNGPIGDNELPTAVPVVPIFSG